MNKRKNTLAVIAVMVIGKIILTSTAPVERNCLVSRIKDRVRYCSVGMIEKKIMFQ